MSCHELEAVRLGLMNVLGVEDRSAREHAKSELEGHLDGPIEGLAEADSLAALRRHLDAALVDLESEVAGTEPTDPEYDYLRGRLVAVRDAELALDRLADHGAGVLDGLGETHGALHEVFPADE
ncbi:DUF3209 family protein [Halegenticoccus tardaugens]|uniref:DUF3209 family protein n=1 Tax=Halegenticoccus tardaugens TaxID=2071624 RepID=UPI00100B08D1|nr:DUF3209 family protein [Halegenticoccus tardaugens]